MIFSLDFMHITYVLCGMVNGNINFEYNEDKNSFLRKERKIVFEDIISEIREGNFIIIDHPDKNKYPNQIIFLVLINNYIHAVPSKIHGNKIVLVTIYKSRKFNKLFKNELKGVLP